MENCRISHTAGDCCKARITKCRDCIENRKINPIIGCGERITIINAEKDGNRATNFDCKCVNYDCENHFQSRHHTLRADHIAKHCVCLEGTRILEKIRNETRKSHHAQSAYLQEHQQDTLTEWRQNFTRVNTLEAGDARCARCHKKAIDKRDFLGGGVWEFQQARANKNYHKKTQCKQRLGSDFGDEDAESVFGNLDEKYRQNDEIHQLGTRQETIQNAVRTNNGI